MDSGRFIRCRNCGAIHHVSPFDRSPVYDLVAGEVEEKQVDDWRAFMDRHAGLDWNRCSPRVTLFFRAVLPAIR